MQEKPSFLMYKPISEAHQQAIYDIISNSVEECQDKIKDVVTQIRASRLMSGSSVYNWMMQMYNHEKCNSRDSNPGRMLGRRPS